ncbi:MAG: ABC transporter permease [Candidatus Limnocylindrales bacterium]
MQTTAATSRIRTLASGDSIQRLLALGALVLLLLFFSIVVPHFASTSNYIDILTATAINGVLATGVTFVIITGGIDLSVGTGMTFASVVMGIVAVNLGLPLIVGLMAALAAGAVVGAVNGALIARAKLPPFIATLGMLYVTLGMAQVISDVHPIYFEATQPTFQQVFMDRPIAGIPNIVWVMFAGAGIAWVLLNKTVLGRYTSALGSNEEATRLSGVNVNRWKIIIYIVDGLFVGLGGIIVTARTASAQPGQGMGYELDAIAAAVIGGTSLSGGEGSVVGTMIGALLISTLRTGLSVGGVPDQWKSVITGLVVIGAVWLDILRRRGRS